MNTNTTPAVFQFNTTELRVIQDEQGELWFVASDVAIALEYRDAANMVRNLDEDEADTHILSIRSENGVEQDREVTVINESGLYSSILKSRKPEAKKFKKWVTSEVLPTIRKTGRYETPTEPSITPAQQRQLQDAIAARFPDGKKRPYAWSRFNNHFQLGSYKQLPTSKTEEALAYIAQMEGGSEQAALERAALDQLKHARFCMYFDNGRMILKEIPQDARLLRDEDLPQLIRDPASAIDHTLLPDIIQAAAGRLKKAG